MKRHANGRRLRITWWLAWPLVVVAVVPAAADSRQQVLLDEAIREYRAALECSERDERLQRFGQAELRFRRLVDGDADGDPKAPSGILNADLYVNLGNAALGAERLGPAVLAYRRALLLDPDHRRANQNLLHARSLLPSWVPRPEEGGLFDTFFSWSRRLSRRERQTAAALMFLAAAGLLAVAVRWRRTVFRNMALVPAVGWAVLWATLLVDDRHSPATAGVVAVPEVVARAADSPHAPARFSQPLPSGTEVDVVEQRDQWFRIALPDSRDAWVPRSTVEFVEQ